MASREALDWLKNAGFDRVLLESDALQVVRSLLYPIENNKYLGGVLLDYCNFLPCFTNISIFYIKRSMNRCIHLLV